MRLAIVGLAAVLVSALPAAAQTPPRSALSTAIPTPQEDEALLAAVASTTRPEADRARLRATAAVYARMPETQRHALGERYAALDAHERDGWRLGPVLGADWPQLHGLFALVPDDQRLALLAMLRSLDDSARADLAMIAQRTPPEERDALRRRLLSMPEAARADWLRVQASPN